jgi:hypothetical protein
MEIIHPSPFEYIAEHDRILRGYLAQRAGEWQCQRGIPRLLTRVKIEFWAWRQTARELRPDLRKLYVQRGG